MNLDNLTKKIETGRTKLVSTVALVAAAAEKLGFKYQDSEIIMNAKDNDLFMAAFYLIAIPLIFYFYDKGADRVPEWAEREIEAANEKVFEEKTKRKMQAQELKSELEKAAAQANGERKDVT